MMRVTDLLALWPAPVWLNASMLGVGVLCGVVEGSRRREGYRLRNASKLERVRAEMKLEEEANGFGFNSRYERLSEAQFYLVHEGALVLPWWVVIGALAGILWPCALLVVGTYLAVLRPAYRTGRWLARRDVPAAPTPEMAAALVEVERMVAGP